MFDTNLPGWAGLAFRSPRLFSGLQMGAPLDVGARPEPGSEELLWWLSLLYLSYFLVGTFPARLRDYPSRLAFHLQPVSRLSFASQFYLQLQR